MSGPLAGVRIIEFADGCRRPEGRRGHPRAVGRCPWPRRTPPPVSSSASRSWPSKPLLGARTCVAQLRARR